MPIRPVPLPAIPPNFVYVKTVMPYQSGLVQSQLYSDHFFMCSTGLSTFNVLTAAVVDFLPQWFRPVFTPIRSSSYVNIGYHFFANVGTHVQSLLISPSWPASTNGAAIGQMFKIRVSRRASSGVDYFWGRFTFPPVPKSFVTGNRLNSTGEAAYATAFIPYMNGWTSQGLLFQPCGWSRKYNTVYPITELRLQKLVTFDRKSRMKNPAHTYAYVWPTVF